MKLSELPGLSKALELLGVDNGAKLNREAVIPPLREQDCKRADVEAKNLTPFQLEDLAIGEYSDQLKVAGFAPTLDLVLRNSFDDGPLAELFFTACTSEVEAREIELEARRKGLLS